MVKHSSRRYSNDEIYKSVHMMTDLQFIKHCKRKHIRLRNDPIPYSSLVKSGYIISLEKSCFHPSRYDLIGPSLDVATYNTPSRLNRSLGHQKSSIRTNPLLQRSNCSSKQPTTFTFYSESLDQEISSSSSVTLVPTDNTLSVVESLPTDYRVGDQSRDLQRDCVDDTIPNLSSCDDLTAPHCNRDRDCDRDRKSSEIVLKETTKNPNLDQLPNKTQAEIPLTIPSKPPAVLSPVQISRNNRRLTRRWTILQSENQTLELELSPKLENNLAHSSCSSYCDLNSCSTESGVTSTASKKLSRLARFKSLFKPRSSLERGSVSNLSRSSSIYSTTTVLTNSSKNSGTKFKFSLRKTKKRNLPAPNGNITRGSKSDLDVTSSDWRSSFVTSPNDWRRSNDSLMTSPEEDLIASCFDEELGEDVITKCFTAQKIRKDPVFLNF